MTAAWWELPDELGIEAAVGEVPTDLPGASRPRPWLQVSARQALVRFRGGAGLLVSDGCRAVVRPPAGEGDSAWLLQGWGVSLAMLQRGRLILHASCVDIGGRTVAICGDRGAGKSTTAMGLLARGHDLLVDDVTILEPLGAGFGLLPYHRKVHLTPEAALLLDLDYESLPGLSAARVKAGYNPDPPLTVGVLRPLDHVVRLVADPAIARPQIEEVSGAARVLALRSVTARDGAAPHILGIPRYFELLSAMADKVPLRIVRRPVPPQASREGWEELLAIVESLTWGSVAAAG
ncbi:MAG: HPr kinase/phosphorylase [Candidatus Nanopelagicales bacterium]